MRITTALCILSLIVLSSSRTVLWTNAGGNPQWEFASNWDCNCVPALTDDVVIDVPFIPGNVRVSNIAYAKSLTVGGSGSGQFPQTLVIQGQLTINGDAKIFPNGLVTLDAAPTAPLTVTGTFTGSDRFIFSSGSLNGTGTFIFSFVNFTGGGFKAINATTTVTDLLYINPGTGNQGTINIVSKQLIIDGNITSSQTFNIFSNPGASLNVKGYFNNFGTSVTNSIIRGAGTINSLISTGGVLTLNDNVTITTANVGAGSKLSLIGNPSSARIIGTILGQGTLEVLGGLNTFGTFTGLNSVVFQSGTITSNSQAATISNFVQNGGTLAGTASYTIGTYTLANAQISGPSVSVTSLNIQGFTGLTNAELILTGMAVIGKDSLFTMSSGAVFTVNPSAKVSQSAGFQLVSSGTQPPSFTNNGVWTTSVGTLYVAVNTAGTGSFQFGTGALLSLNGIAFNTQKLTLTGSKLYTTGSVVSINTIEGNGVVLADGRQFFVSSIAAYNYTHTNGFSQLGSGSIDNLYVVLGNVNVTATTFTIGNLTFEGGEIAGQNTVGVTLNIGNTTLVGHEPKTFVSVTARSQTIELSCGTEQCQLFTQNALLTTKKKTGSNKH